ncbi:hypothetical protein HYALB_00004040 [Hymenoscyphus albidus]|uniref:U1-type domain-containing protein n=1 Tax=Hymenoscyphus albidus TaxID=595503 RepID=A0A9N9M322_9HELO|nr:hypothetical protein HYALB_00004040 [Hymenoscyphus albidus]
MATSQWNCNFCNIWMPWCKYHQHISSERHTVAITKWVLKDDSKKHPSTVARLEQKGNRHQPPTPEVKERWSCAACDIEMGIQNKDSHLSGKRHAVAMLSQSEGSNSATSSSSQTAIPVPESIGDHGSKLQLQHQGIAARKSCKANDQVIQKIIQTVPTPHSGPLDSFFGTFIGFLYDVSLPPSDSFRLLRYRGGSWHHWNPNTYETRNEYENELWERYQAALTSEFNMWFGIEDDIKAWHSLCRAVNIQPLPTTCRACRFKVRSTHVKIVDLIQWGRAGESGKVVIFETVKELSEYSYEENKIYQKDQLGQGAVLRHLLRKLTLEC